MRLLIILALATSACSGPSNNYSPSTPTPAVPFSDLKPLVGTYSLTIELDNRCSDFPVAARRRTYRGELEDRGWHFLLVRVLGGGYSEATQLGELFSGELTLGRSAEPQLRWNVSELGCDIAEPLEDSSRLAVCGRGPAVRSASGLDAAINGSAHLWLGSAVVAQCTGTHRFSFIRTGE